MPWLTDVSVASQVRMGHIPSLLAQVTDLGIARDTEGHVQGCLERAISSGVDILITSGEGGRRRGPSVRVWTSSSHQVKGGEEEEVAIKSGCGRRGNVHSPMVAACHPVSTKSVGEAVWKG